MDQAIDKDTFKKAYRLTLYVPQDQRAALIRTLSPHIPSLDGLYDHVLWWSDEGTEQFRPLAGSNPASGAIGDIVQKPSSRIDMILPHDRQELQRFIADILLPAHPWEKPVYFITSVEIAA